MADLPEGHDATATLAGLVELFDRVPKYLKRTLCWDQGREIARHHDLADLAEIDPPDYVFFGAKTFGPKISLTPLSARSNWVLVIGTLCQR